jgi:hypothetical protein
VVPYYWYYDRLASRQAYCPPLVESSRTFLCETRGPKEALGQLGIALSYWLPPSSYSSACTLYPAVNIKYDDDKHRLLILNIVSGSQGCLPELSQLAKVVVNTLVYQ